MEDHLFALVCGPFALVTTVLNVIFILCLSHPAAGVNLCQPLRFLLIVVVGNSTIQQGTTILTTVLTFLNAPEQLQVMLKSLIYLTYCSCFSSNAWISIFYFVKIVPLHYAIMLWIKRNIRIVVYIGVIFGKTTLLTAIILGTVPYLHPPSSFVNSTSSPGNGTMPVMDKLDMLLANLCNLVFIIYLIFPLITLTVSWIRIFVYLRGHIRNMKNSTGSTSSPQQKNQKRVAVMGMVQAALFLPSCLWTLFTVIVYSTPTFEKVDNNKYVTLTISSASDLANMICLGLSQSVFRLTLAVKWKGLKEAIGLLDHSEETD